MEERLAWGMPGAILIAEFFGEILSQTAKVQVNKREKSI
jgi:hypothetical protein